MAALPTYIPLPVQLYELDADLIVMLIEKGEITSATDPNNNILVEEHQKGIVKRLGSDSYRTLIDKADIAYCAKIYEKHGGQRKTLF